MAEGEIFIFILPSYQTWHFQLLETLKEHLIISKYLNMLSILILLKHVYISCSELHTREKQELRASMGAGPRMSKLGGKEKGGLLC